MLWISFALILIVLTHQYAPVLKGILFTPGYTDTPGFTR